MAWLQLRNYKIAKLTPTKRRNDHSNIFLSRFRAYVQKIESLAAGRLNYTAKELFGKRVLKSLRKSLKCFWPLQATNENKFCSFVVEIKISFSSFFFFLEKSFLVQCDWLDSSRSASSSSLRLSLTAAASSSSAWCNLCTSFASWDQSGNSRLTSLKFGCKSTQHRRIN